MLEIFIIIQHLCLYHHSFHVAVPGKTKGVDSLSDVEIIYLSQCALQCVLQYFFDRLKMY